jgi:predicted enzyme related to lactoylglutathione lyase
MLKYIRFTDLPVRDLERARDFYAGVLGFEILADAPYGEGRWVELGLPGAQTRLTLSAPDAAGDPTKARLVLVTDDLEKTYRELSAKGVEFTTPPRETFYGKNAIFKDSEGNLVVLGAE